MSDKADIKKVFDLIKEHDVKFVDFRFTDPRGKWQHTAQTVETADETMLEEGIMFDGSSIAGWKGIEASDMTLMPDASTAVMDPFSAQPHLILFCDVLEPTTGQPYERDPRSTARRAEAFIKESGIADQAWFGPELEFFVFDDVRFDVGEPDALITDRVEDTVDYAQVCDIVALAATERSYRTLERLCQVVGERLLERYASDSVRVRAAKPDPPTPICVTVLR